MDLDVLDYVPSPIVVLDRAADGAFVYVWMNRAATDFSGLDLSDMFCRTAQDVFPGRAGERLSAYQAEAGRDGEPKSYSYSLRLPTGERWIETKLEPILGSDGAVARLIANMTDRTQENRLEQRQVLADSSMLTMQAEMEQFIAMAAHDLRTPMRQIRQITQVLRDSFVDHGDGKVELIDTLEEIAIKSSELITDVLAYARSREAVTKVGEVTLSHMAGDVFAVLDPQRRHGLSCEPVTIEVDEVALQIVVRNLVDNALKHGGRERLELKICCQAGDDGFLAFSVHDTGRGFDDPGLAFLDNGEFRYDSGFGLLGIKQLVTARGGTIWAEGPPSGPGSIVRFTLPGRVLEQDGAGQSGPCAAVGPSI